MAVAHNWDVILDHDHRWAPYGPLVDHHQQPKQLSRRAFCALYNLVARANQKLQIPEAPTSTRAPRSMTACLAEPAAGLTAK
jgi:hypothetical protein